MWSTGEGSGKPLQYSCLENPMNSMKRQNDRILKEEFPRSVGAQYATGDQWRNNSRKNEGMEPKQKQHPAVDVTGDRSKVRCCKEQYCIGTWNVRSMNQGKLEVVKQEMARVNVDILGISELRWTGMGEFNSDDHYIYYCRQEFLRRNGVAIMVNKRVQNAVQFSSLQFTSVTQSCPTLCNLMNRSTPVLPVHHQLRSSLRLTSIEPVMPSSHLILGRPHLLLSPIPPSIKVFSNESTLRMSCPF